MLYYAAPMEGLQTGSGGRPIRKWFGAQGAADRYYAPFISPPENQVLIKKEDGRACPGGKPRCAGHPAIAGEGRRAGCWMIGQLRALAILR